MGKLDCPGYDFPFYHTVNYLYVILACTSTISGLLQDMFKDSFHECTVQFALHKVNLGALIFWSIHTSFNSKCSFVKKVQLKFLAQSLCKQYSYWVTFRGICYLGVFHPEMKCFYISINQHLTHRGPFIFLRNWYRLWGLSMTYRVSKFTKSLG